MKKLLLITSIISSLFATTALAKTEGSSVGISLFKAEATHKSSLDKNSPFSDDSYRGVSLNYKYSIPLVNDFYIAPGVAAEHVGTSITNTSTSTGSDKVNLNNRFNVRADIGYDVNDHLAVYGLAGYSAIGYEVYNFNAGSFSQKKNSFEMAPLFGAGFKTAISKNVDLTFEYTTQRANLHTSTSLEKTKTKLNTYGIGLAYNF